MTADAKSELSRTIQNLRAHLLQRLNEATNSFYRLQIENIEEAELTEETQIKRKRLEEWLDEQVRGEQRPEKEHSQLRERFLQEAIKRAAYTHINRHVYLRLLEGFELREKLLTGGWSSQAFQDFSYFISPLLDDETKGYGFVLSLAFDDLATELPGLFGRGGIEELIPLPASDLRKLVEELDKPELETCWTDDMTLGWVYQFWNDPEKSKIDAKVNGGGKVENHEIASKTQLFTERYMVNWLLQNSLGAKWLAICKKNDWTPDVISKGTLESLEKKRADWREKREKEEVALTDLMPLKTELEKQWVYYVQQPISEEDVEHAPDSIRNLKMIDPACGSGHFLVIAMDLLFALYQEEAKHRKTKWSEKFIVESILSNNLHGLDIDPRAVQIAAAALMLKAKTLSKEAKPSQLNLVASQLRLSGLKNDDPVILDLIEKVEQETGIDKNLTLAIITSLKGADYLGTLLKINEQVDQLIANQANNLSTSQEEQLVLFGEQPKTERPKISPEKAKELLIRRLTEFLGNHTRGDDLGLQLRGRQLAVGLRFLQINRENTYDLVVGNPPYQGTGKMKEKKYLEKEYKAGKSDLYTCFMIRGLQLCRPSGLNAMITIRGWMFISTFTAFREHIFGDNRIKLIADLHFGAFSAIKDVSVTMAITQNLKPAHDIFRAVRPVQSEIVVRDVNQPARNESGLQVPYEIFVPDIQKLKGIEGWPLIYWWDERVLNLFEQYPFLAEKLEARKGIITGNGARFDKLCWEVSKIDLSQFKYSEQEKAFYHSWVPTIKGAQGRKWIEPVKEYVQWFKHGLELKVKHEFDYGSFTKRVQSQDRYFKKGVAFSSIGSNFGARHHRIRSLFGNAGSSIFSPEHSIQICCLLNSTTALNILNSLNPTINFEVGDVNRLPLFPIESANEIYAQLDQAFTKHESHREASVEFKSPGSSCWSYAQDWAQESVDRAEDAPLPEWKPVYEVEPPTDHISYALGIALGRFKPNNTGILDPSSDDLSHALDDGILFLNGTLSESTLTDSLGEEACKLLIETWKKYCSSISGKNTDNLRDYLRLAFFNDVHLKMYEKRPIHWPLSSENKNFVAWVNIHRMNKETLRRLRAFHLEPAKENLESLVKKLLEAKQTNSDKSKQRELEESYEVSQNQLIELTRFIEDIRQCGELGAPVTDAKCAKREVDALYDPDLDDGVMINSAGLWPLLYPQWRDPKKWWAELSNSKGKKDYDWSHLAMKYWPTRVDGKCQEDPSLGVAHGCFWKYHAERAWAWELRLQDEIGAEFVIEEDGHEGFRSQYFLEHADKARAAAFKEVGRREKKSAGANSIVLNRSGLWAVSPKSVWELEDEIAQKLFDTRVKEFKKLEKLAKSEKRALSEEELAMKPVLTEFVIDAPDREEHVLALVEKEKALQEKRVVKYGTSEEKEEPKQGRLF